jgi:ribose-phosphate pyrophosphokinase
LSLLEKAAGGKRVPSAPPLLFAGSSHPELSQRIAAELGLPLGEVVLKQFANGETYCRYGESVRGADVFLVQSCVGKVNDYVMETLLLANAAKLAGSKRITAVLSWFPYSRQDKKGGGREPISARLLADLLGAAGVNRILSVDLHAGQIQGFFGGPFDHMTALPLFVDYLKAKGLEGDKVVVVSPDAGRVKTARRFADKLGCEMAMLNKHRPGHDQAAVSHLVGADLVAGKVCVMTDDIIATGGTLAAGAEALKAAGAKSVYACATHGLLPAGARHALADVFAEIVVTDTVPAPPDAAEWHNLRVLSVAPLLARTIAHVWSNESVSSLFEGDNERLF